MGATAALCGVALLCALGLGQRPGAMPSCGPGRFLAGEGTAARCCGPCAPGEAPCPGRNCTCVQAEFHCGDPQCSTCKHHACPPGQEAQPRGSFSFGFQCVECAEGTFSMGSGAHCRPWADCSLLGFLTAFPGNKTHNAACIPGPVPRAPSRWLLPVLLAVTACILLLTAAQLGLHIWQLNRAPAVPGATTTGSRGVLQLAVPGGGAWRPAGRGEGPGGPAGMSWPEHRGRTPVALGAGVLLPASGLALLPAPVKLGVGQ
ncbi:tumor necrosis factor receptor superfamily member 18 isoform X1 [Ochotona princeps]|uniref:tumor necrosis factor receptor superfamily member 18 isoform X1 n=1 Tax=Ochotona princeps TaxID=9978 RepID=UPI002715436B|nr:tumor necrosis factor receptor superfamily member 18 isoform X1 [Ochotona princeps]